VGIEVRIFGTLRLESGRKRVIVEAGPNGKSIRKILFDLGRRKGLSTLREVASEEAKSGAPFIILCDGKNCMELDGLDTLVREGQVLSIFPPSGGG